MRLLVGPLLALLLTACGSEQGGGTTAAELPSGTYAVVSPPSPFDGDERIEVSFTDTGLGFVAGCNGHQATDASWDDGTLRVGGFAATEIGCPGDGNDEDAWLAEFLGSEPAIGVAGDEVTLTSGEVTLTLLPADRVAPPPGQEDRPLVGTRWRLTGIEEVDDDAVAMRVVPRRTGAVLEVGEDEFRFETGCNTGGGAVEVDGDRLVLSRVVITARGCPEGADAEAAQVDVLMGASATWSVDGTSLRVSRGRTALLYTSD